MPPNGLWPIPRHHLYGSSSRRRTWNARDFAEQKTENTTPETAKHGKAMNMPGLIVAHETKSKKHERDAEHAVATTQAATSNRAPNSNTKAKRSIEEAAHAKEHGEPPKTKGKRRKRESEVVVSKGLSTDPDGAHAEFLIDSATPVPQRAQQSMKKLKTHRNPGQHGITDRASNSDVQVASSPIKKSYISVPGTAECDSNSPAKKTPIPLPERTSASAPTVLQNENAGKSTNDHCEGGFIIPETPPSRSAGSFTMFNSPIPLPHSSLPDLQATPSQRTTAEPGGAESMTFEHLSKEPEVTAHQSSVDKHGRKYVGWANLASSATKRLTQPLTDESKPKPKSRPKTPTRRSRSSSVASGVSSTSISDMFKRISTATEKSETSPIANEILVSRAIDSRTFALRFSLLQQCVDYAAEHEYLAQHQDWITDNTSPYPFPCLGRLTGCSTAKEEKMQRSKRDGDAKLSIHKQIDVHGGVGTVLDEAAERAQTAEHFLIMALKARIPVPLGVIEGTWTLYCPEYSRAHYDHFGYGTRSLTITALKPARAQRYMARLNMPPRPMPFPISGFTLPPHASFRSVVVKTVEEECEIDLVFLGNGYLLLRVDLNLLLRGAPMKKGGRKVWMEFVGVHGESVEWAETNK